MHVHGKTGKRRDQFRNLLAIGSAFARDVSIHKNSADKYAAATCPWGMPGEEPNVASSSMHMRDFSDKKLVLGMGPSHGIKQGLQRSARRTT